MKPEVRRFDALVIGAGGAGLRAALQLSNANADVAVVSKVFPTRSHTVAAQGGINAALGNVLPDSWHWHMYDTVKGSDWLGDQDAIEFMCQKAPRAVIELEHYGIPFSRLDNGKIYQRRFGGQSQHFGGEQAARTCAAADRTGHVLLHTLYQQNLRAKTHFFDEYFALDLIRGTDGDVLGAVVLCIESGQPLVIQSKATLLATGGGGQIFRTNTNALGNTGDGLAMCLRAGLALEDMEFFQFHPTGIAGKGLLITEGARGEGGYLVNRDGERFMERYATHAKDLAGRDVVSRAIYTEVKEGRGRGADGGHVDLKLDHLGKAVVHKRLPGITELAKTFLGIDPAAQPIPVYPTAHYMMGGIPTSLSGEVTTPHRESAEEAVPGLFAAGECGCVSVHGANRLGGNSLLDLVVFGQATGSRMIEHIHEQGAHPPLPQASVDEALARLARWDRQGDGESVYTLKAELQSAMEQYCGVFRDQATLDQGVAEVKALESRLRDAVINDHSRVFNTARVEALELENLMETALATVVSAAARLESRGAHSRVDYPQRDDKNWLRHSMYFKADYRMDYKPVHLKPSRVESFPPKARVY